MPVKMTYPGVGVDYNTIDPFKRKAIQAALTTIGNILRLGFKVRSESYGESAFLLESTDNLPYILAHVEEGLGTKNLVADMMYVLTGRSYYDHIAQCTVAMIVNDLVTLGALPVSVAMHLAVGVSNWFNDHGRTDDLVFGWKNACDLARCVWGGGETPTLKGVVVPNAVVLAGSAVGVVKPKERLITGKIRAGDVMVFIGSSGIHANGLTLARAVAENLAKTKDSGWRKLLRKIFSKLPVSKKALGEAYLTKLSDGRAYGEALLDKTLIYVGLVEDCQNAGVDIHYAVNITGHGWRKLMRSVESWTYVVKKLPKQLPIFDFLQQHGPIDDREAYSNFNMGAGFALYVSEADAVKVLEVAKHLGFEAFVAGHIEEGPKRVVIEPYDMVFEADTLAVR